MELSLRAEDSERRTRNAWTVMTPANVRIALHCDADAVLHFALMLIHPGFVASQRFLALHLTRASNPSHPALRPGLCLAPLSHLRHAQHTVQSGVGAAYTLFYPPSRAPRVFAGGLQARAEREAASGVVAGVISR